MRSPAGFMRLLAGAVALALTFWPQLAPACSVVFPPEEEAVRRAEVIFAGVVVRLGPAVKETPEDLFGYREIEFSVERVWKGTVGGTARVRTGHDSCGLRVWPGEKWLILAAGQPLRADLVSGGALLRLSDGRRTEHTTASIEKRLGKGTPPAVP